ncbi:hypothetical protein [Paenibacillus macquariensis]|uniref:hypothetical protein n=1 Tax=Paenibacillus macquariensis TaxID=948756 RepID=UPI001471D3FA|nr:hypothetical protein [Paenibacillus macquariensis]MEC0092868.1 hypothetical protein [Paenibacillus macquariensis]
MYLLPLIVAELGCAVGHSTLDVDRQGCCAGDGAKSALNFIMTFMVLIGSIPVKVVNS